MRIRTSFLTVLVAVLSQFAPLSLADWEFANGARAAQINFYTDTDCTAYNGEAVALYDRAPHVSIAFYNIPAACIPLKMPGGS
jgi:hypothetical protein